MTLTVYEAYMEAIYGLYICASTSPAGVNGEIGW